MKTYYSMKNTIVQFITNIITILFAFIAQALFIRILGIEYNGLNGLFNNILTILNLFELGISSSITYNLYKFVKDNNIDVIKSIMSFYKKTYNYIMLIIFIVGLLIIPFIKFFTNNIYLNINIYIVYLLFLISTVASYVVSYKRNILIANQKNYIINIIHIIYIIILNIIQIIILYFTKNYYIYLIIKIICILLENITISIKVNKMYPYIKDNNIKVLDSNVKNNIIIRVKALIIHKISGAVTNGTDNILITYFFGIAITGIYIIYDYIINSIRTIFGNSITSITSSIGILLVEDNKEKNYNAFKKIIFLNYWIVVFTSVCLLLLIEPFISFWFGSEYLLKIDVLIVLIVNYYQSMMRKTYSSFKSAGGIWVEDRYLPIIQIIINIFFSILLSKLIGLSGIFIGTILSSLVLWLYSYPKYVYIRLFGKSIKEYIILLIKHTVIFIFVLSISYIINLYFNNIFISLLICIFIPNILLIIIYRNNLEYKYYKSILVKFCHKFIKKKNM